MKKRPDITISLVFQSHLSEFGKKNALILPLFKFDRACRGGHGDIISRLLELKKQLEVDLDNRLGTIHLLRKHL